MRLVVRFFCRHSCSCVLSNKGFVSPLSRSKFTHLLLYCLAIHAFATSAYTTLYSIIACIIASDDLKWNLFYLMSGPPDCKAGFALSSHDAAWPCMAGWQSIDLLLAVAKHRALCIKIISTIYHYLLMCCCLYRNGVAESLASTWRRRCTGRRHYHPPLSLFIIGSP